MDDLERDTTPSRLEMLDLFDEGGSARGSDADPGERRGEKKTRTGPRTPREAPGKRGWTSTGGGAGVGAREGGGARGGAPVWEGRAVLGLPDVSVGSRVSVLVNVGQRGDMGRLHAASEAYAKRAMIEKVQAITDRLVHVGKAVIQDQAEAAAEDAAPVAVKGEREVRGKVICGEEKVMIVFHEKLGLAALSAQIKTELNIQVAFVLRCRKQDGSVEALDSEKLLVSAVADALAASRPMVMQAFTALDKEKEEADLARRLAEKEKAEMEEAQREAERVLREAEEAVAEAARLAEEAKVAAAAFRKEEEEAEEAEAEAEVLKAKKEALEQEVLLLKQAAAAARSRGPPAVKSAAAALAAAEAKLVAASVEYQKAEKRALKEREEAEDAKKEAAIQVPLEPLTDKICGPTRECYRGLLTCGLLRLCTSHRGDWSHSRRN